LIALAGMELELGELAGGRKVDLRTPQELSCYFRDEVLAAAELQYAPEDYIRIRHMLDAVIEALAFAKGHGRCLEEMENPWRQ